MDRHHARECPTRNGPGPLGLRLGVPALPWGTVLGASLSVGRLTPLCDNPTVWPTSVGSLCSQPWLVQSDPTKPGPAAPASVATATTVDSWCFARDAAATIKMPPTAIDPADHHNPSGNRPVKIPIATTENAKTMRAEMATIVAFLPTRTASTLLFARRSVSRSGNSKTNIMARWTGSKAAISHQR